MITDELSMCINENLPDGTVGKIYKCHNCMDQGRVMYDHNHSKPCDACCPHSGGWFELSKMQSGHVEGLDNGCCKLGCGKLRRSLANKCHWMLAVGKLCPKIAEKLDPVSGSLYCGCHADDFEEVFGGVLVSL